MQAIETMEPLRQWSPYVILPHLFFKQYKLLMALNCVVYLTNRFHVAVRLFSNRSQMTSKCRKNKEVAHKPQASVSVMFLPHFDVLCDL